MIAMPIAHAPPCLKVKPTPEALAINQRILNEFVVGIRQSTPGISNEQIKGIMQLEFEDYSPIVDEVSRGLDKAEIKIRDALASYGLEGAALEDAKRMLRNTNPEWVNEMDLSFESLKTKDKQAIAEFPLVDIAATHESLDEVGGDILEATKIGDLLILEAGDVSGHGIPAAIYKAFVQHATSKFNQNKREYEEARKKEIDALQKIIADTSKSKKDIDTAKKDLDRIQDDSIYFVRIMNELIWEAGLARGNFVSYSRAVIDTKNNKLKIISAGANPIFILTKKGIKKSKPPGIALGFDKGPLFNQVLGYEEIDLQSGDKIVVYSDGITEEMNPANKKFDETALADLRDGNGEFAITDEKIGRASCRERV